MSNTASVNFKTEFDPLVKHAYQGESKLIGKVRTRANVNAKTYSFPKLGKGVAQLRIPQTDVVPMNIVHTKTDITLYDYDASEYVAIEDLDKLAFDEKMELVKTVGMSIGRRIDQAIIDAMAASAFATQVGDDEGGTNSSLNIEKITLAHQLLTANGVPMSDRYLAINAKALRYALLETAIGSSDFNVTRALAAGEIKTYAGFEFIVFEDRTEGGIPLSTSNVRNCFAFHKDSVGLAMTGGVKSEVNYIPEKKSWLISSGVTLGAGTIDTDGVIDVLTYEA